MWITIILSSILCLALLARLWLKERYKYWAKHRVPHAKASLFSGDIWDFLSLKTNYGYHLKAIYANPKFKNDAVVGVYGVHKPGLLIRDPELIKTILIKDFDKFGERSLQCDPIHDPVANMTLFFGRYDYWKSMRAKMSPVFSSGKLKYMYPLLQEVGKNLELHLSKKGERFTEEFKLLSSKFTTDSISTTILGFQSNALENSNVSVYIEALKLGKFNIGRAVTFLFILFMPSLLGVFRLKAFYKSTYDFMKSSINYIVADREKSGHKRNDVVDIFVNIKKEAETAGENAELTMNGLYAQAVILMSGGFETSSTVISSALFELAKQPKLLERLREEILAAFAEGNGEISYEKINSMEYLRMVFDETLRKYPVLPLLDRAYVAPDTKAGYSLKPYYNYEIPNGMSIYISAYGLHYDPKVRL